MLSTWFQVREVSKKIHGGQKCKADLELGALDRVRDVIDDHVDEAGCGAEELAENEAEERPNVHLVHHRLQDDAEGAERSLERLRVLPKDLS